MVHLLKCVANLGSLALSTAASLNLRQSTIPSVDLGYEIHTATTNTSGDYYIFSNIPYAQQPVDSLRFQFPVAITGNDSTVNNGSTTPICIQGAPLWSIEQAAAQDGLPVEVVEQFLWNEAGQTEACLVLDVYVPESTFNNNSSSKSRLLPKYNNGSKDLAAPVLVYIHGGGFTVGSKDSNPAGLIARSQLNDGEGIVFVAINYRLGLYGWLGGAEGTIPNLGLHDQMMALHWIQKYIPLFGGDPEQVTVMGESARGSSIVFHLTSYGGDTQLPFNKAITQSPAFQFNLNMTKGYEITMKVASNVTGTSISSVAELSALDAETLKTINQQSNLEASWGNVMFGPAPDGTYVPKLPQTLLAEGAFNKDIELLIGHNSAEAVTFVDPNISTDAELVASLEIQFPEINNDTLTYILDILYPAANYSSSFLRAVQIETDSSFACITRYLALAEGNNTYNYLFAVSPGYHAEDSQYTFYNGDFSTPDNGVPVDVAIAYALQNSIVGFTQVGNPNKDQVALGIEFPVYGKDAQVLGFTDTGLVVEKDDMDNARCEWWQRVMIEGLV
ncbi:Carboxylesterase patB [Lachnellula suecica]|uniref:Carboxylesterase patB n=1 Tax=Lachnellula suecica TaxID=602035 RepID=A0A8T9C5L9_9HELO|nr:Carboxylesterase patB [Lachnellula suecica]